MQTRVRVRVCASARSPFTLVTVDSGYSAVTEDNGQQKILEGGSTYLLTHRNWKLCARPLLRPLPSPVARYLRCRLR